jgi:7-carboxy-7-deazaguanine synthase
MDRAVTTIPGPVTRDTLVLSEVFGPTVQGEGPSTGRIASFIRLGGCNLSCSWCDTPYTWDSTRFDLRAELRREHVQAIAERALAGGPGLVVISGGEPMLQQRQPGWTALLDLLAAAEVDVEVETNGTRVPSPETLDRGVRFNVSPKLTHSGDSAARRIRPAALVALVGSGQAIFKFVAATEADVDETAELATRYGLPARLVWISPEGVDVEAVLRHSKVIAGPTIRHGFNLGTRLHTLVWGNERGR